LIVCVRLKVMSRQHANLLFAFWMDIALVLFEVVSVRWASVALVTINEICVISILACFEQLNDIAILERQIETYARHNQDVSKKHEKAMDDWKMFEQLHDLWEYRTMPSLAFYEKVHLRLENKDQECKRGMLAPEARLEWFRYANAQLNVLELKFGPVEDWRGAEPLDEEWKSTRGRQLKERSNSDADVDQLLKIMPFMLSKNLLQLEADGAIPDIGPALPSSARSSPQGSPRIPGSSSSSFASQAGGSDPGASVQSQGVDPERRRSIFGKRRS